MPTFKPNPEAETNLAFDTISPGVYRVRIIEVTEFQSKTGNTCWRVRLEHLDPTACTKLDGSIARNPGTLLDSSLVVSDPAKQGKLRSLVEACGKSWGQLTDSEELVGCELSVKVGTEEYNGELVNRVQRYLLPEA